MLLKLNILSFVMLSFLRFFNEKPDKVATVPKVCVYHPTLNFHRLENLRKWKWKRKCMLTVDLVRIYNKSWLINTTCYLLSATWLNRDQSQISNISAFSLFASWLSFHSDLNFDVGILNFEFWFLKEGLHVLSFNT